MKKDEKDTGSPNHLENMEERLYSRNEDADKERSKQGFYPLSKFGSGEADSPVRSEWNYENMKKNKKPESINSRNTFSLLKQILAGSVILFLVSVGIAAYVFLGNHNIVSTKNILININMPITVPGGEPLPVEVSISNQNNVQLVSADVVIEYPSGARQADDLSKTLTRYRESIGPVGVGVTVNKKYQAVFFGEEGESKDIKVSLEYRVNGSDAIFTTSETRTVRLSSAPVSVSVDGSTEASPGANSVFTVTVVANSSQEIQHLMLVADYPFGFVESGADPKPTSNNNIWDLGDLRPGATRVVKINGQFNGNEGDQQAIRFSVGSPDKNDNRKIGVVFLSKTLTVAITKPFIGVNLVLGGSNDHEYVTSAGSPVRADIVFSNNLDTKITNVSVRAKLIGTIFDRNSVSTSAGFFQSINNAVIWDQKSKSDLAEMEPGDKRTLSFSFNTLGSAVSAYSPSMSVEVTVTGNRVTSSAATEQVEAVATKIIKIVSELRLSSKILYSTGPFQNSGPVPPKAEQQTTYTAVLSLVNSSNDLSNVEVTTSIPIYVNWLGNTSPDNENIKYDPVGGKIIWDVGDLKAGVPKEVNFQISFLPSINQIGEYPILLNKISASGYDGFSGVNINASDSGPLDISLPGDSVYSATAGPVSR